MLASSQLSHRERREARSLVTEGIARSGIRYGVFAITIIVYSGPIES